MTEILLLLVAGPLMGIVAAFVLSRREVLSGRLALGLSTIPYAGFVLALVFC